MKLTLNDFRSTSFEKFNHVTDSSYPLKDFLGKYKNKCDFDIYLPSLGVNLQRPYTWDDKQRSELIESFFKGIYIPPITFIYSRTIGAGIDETMYRIIDGKQRLTTFMMFYRNEFPLLKYGLEFYYKDLSEMLQGKFDTMWVKCNVFYEYRYLDKPTESILFSDEDLIDLFEFLNFKGTPQDENHLIELRNKINKL